MPIVEGTLKERRVENERREAAIKADLVGSKKLLEKWKREKKQKRKSVGELMLMLDIENVRGFEIRPPHEHTPRSRNLDRQVRGLLDHIFTLYRVPDFLYPACIRIPERDNGLVRGDAVRRLGLNERIDPFPDNRSLYRTWFITLAQGGSFSKLVKNVMTRREADMFLSAPSNLFVHECVWWAKMRVANISPRQIPGLIERIFRNRSFEEDDSRMTDLIQFFGRFGEQMNQRTFEELLDCIAWKLEYDPAFRLKGRTVGSMVKISNEWHVVMQRAKLDRHIAWEGLGLNDWVCEARDAIWSVTELRDNKELYAEGRRMHHCVYSYVTACTDGRCAIFSLRKHSKVPNHYDDCGRPVWELSPITELGRATLEVSGEISVVQARAKLNAPLDQEQRKVMRQWAAESAVRIASYIV